MTVRIFMDLQDFKANKKAGENGVTQAFLDECDMTLGEYRDFIANCTSCFNCIDCEDCNDCHDCHYCQNCDNCDNCDHCTACHDCRGCKDCVGCKNCDDCRCCDDCDGMACALHTISNKCEKTAS